MELPQELTRKINPSELNDFLNSFEKGNLPIFKRYIAQLKNQNTNFNAINSKGETFLHYLVAEPKYTHLISLLKEEVSDLDLERRNAKGWTPLHFASVYGNYEAARALVKMGANINVQDDHGHTPLHLAFDYKQVKIIELFKIEGASLQAADQDGKTPIFHAVETIAFEFVDPVPRKEYINKLKIIGVPLNFNVKDIYGRSILHLVALENRIEEVEALVADGCFVDAQDKEGDTPLHVAAMQGHIEMLATLHKAGGRLELKNIEGFTCLHLAVKTNNPPLAKALIDMGADINSKSAKGLLPLHLATLNDSEELVQLLLNAGADIEAVDCDGKNVLHLAAQVGSLLLLKFFISQGIDKELQDKKGNTALHCAVVSSQEAIVKCLLEAKSSSKIPNEDGFSAKMLATYNRQEQIGLLFKEDLYSKEMTILKQLLFLTELEPEANYTFPYFLDLFCQRQENFIQRELNTELNADELEILKDAYSFLATQENVQECVARVRLKKPLIIASGWLTGYILILFFKDKLLIANRAGGRPDGAVLTTLEFNPLLLDEDILKDLLSLREKNLDESDDFIYGAFISKIEAKEFTLPRGLKPHGFLPHPILNGCACQANLQLIDFAFSAYLQFERRYDLMATFAEIEREVASKQLLLSSKTFNSYLILHLPEGQNHTNSRDKVFLEAMLDIKLLNRIWIKLNNSLERFKNENDALSRATCEELASSQRLWGQLLQNGDQYRLDVFIQGIQLDDEEVQWASCKALMSYAKISFPIDSIDPLLKICRESKNIKLKVYALEILALVNKAGVEKTVKGLLPLLVGPNAILSSAALRALKRIGNLAVTYLIEAIKDVYGKERSVIIGALGKMGIGEKTLEEILSRMDKNKSNDPPLI